MSNPVLRIFLKNALESLNVNKSPVSQKEKFLNIQDQLWYFMHVPFKIDGKCPKLNFKLGQL